MSDVKISPPSLVRSASGGSSSSSFTSANGYTNGGGSPGSAAAGVAASSRECCDRALHTFVCSHCQCAVEMHPQRDVSTEEVSISRSLRALLSLCRI
jgi:hypothetical protein